MCIHSHLLQTENKRLGTENLIHLSGFTESLLNDVAIIIVILRQRKEKKEVKVIQFSTFIFIYRFLLTIANIIGNHVSVLQSRLEI